MADENGMETQKDICMSTTIPIMSNPLPKHIIPHLRIYKRRHKDGGSLYLVLIQGSIAYSTIRVCINYAKSIKDWDAVMIGNLMMRLSHEQKRQVLLKLGE